VPSVISSIKKLRIRIIEKLQYIQLFTSAKSSILAMLTKEPLALHRIMNTMKISQHAGILLLLLLPLVIIKFGAEMGAEYVTALVVVMLGNGLVVKSSLLRHRRYYVQRRVPEALASYLRRCALLNIKPDVKAIFGTHFSNVTLKGLDLAGIDFEGCCFDGAILENVSLDRCNLSYASFVQAKLLGVALRGASLAGANFKGSVWRNVIAEDANFMHARLTAAAWDRVQVTNACMDHMDASKAYFHDVTFSGASCKHAMIRHSVFNECQMDTMLLEHANLVGSIDDSSRSAYYDGFQKIGQWNESVAFA
jgi:uncharacterized protein YjbI with pentapeptide repeats